MILLNALDHPFSGYSKDLLRGQLKMQESQDRDILVFLSGHQLNSSLKSVQKFSQIKSFICVQFSPIDQTI